MTWHTDQLKPKTPLLVFGVTPATCLAHMCAHERSLLSLSANRKPPWLLCGGGAWVCVSESGPMRGEQHKQWECRWVHLFLWAKVGRKKKALSLLMTIQTSAPTSENRKNPISRWIRKHTRRGVESGRGGFWFASTKEYDNCIVH